MSVSTFWKKINKPVKLKKMAITKNNVDYCIMKVILVHLNAYDSSSLDKPDCV